MSINPAAFIAMKKAGKLWKRKCGTAKRTKALGTISPKSNTDKLITATKSGKKVSCGFAKGTERAKAAKTKRTIEAIRKSEKKRNPMPAWAKRIKRKAK